MSRGHSLRTLQYSISVNGSHGWWRIQLYLRVILRAIGLQVHDTKVLHRVPKYKQHMASIRRRSNFHLDSAARSSSHREQPKTLYPPEGYCLLESDLHRATTSLQVLDVLPLGVD